ncbi:MAG: hypothetical protein ACYCX4_12960 [Bacillota bacterium]
MYYKTMLRRQKAITPEALASTTASVARSISVTGPCTLICTTGALWMNAAVTATTTNGLLLWEGFKSVDLEATGTISVVSDTTTAKCQLLSWDY